MDSTTVIIPKFILDALSKCLDSKLVPSIRDGGGGRSHSVWFISFSLLKDNKLYDFEVKVTSSYSQQFLNFIGYSGLGFDGFTQFNSMNDCICLAQLNVKQLN